MPKKIISKNRVIFFIASHVHVLDLAGPLQVFYEAATYNIPYQIVYVSNKDARQFSSGLGINGLAHFSTVDVTGDDILIIPGFDLYEYNKEDYTAFYTWLQHANEQKAVICSICTGAFALAKAGLLNGIESTTHWKYVTGLQEQFPETKVLQNRLFVTADNIYTSAGITTGIDMALYIMEERHGPQFAYQLARELVVYMRRDGDHAQESIYLQHRQHINNHIHTIQDWIVNHLAEKITIEGLAAMVYTSPRNLTRLFKNTTGVTIGAYVEKMRAEKAMQLLKAGEKVTAVNHACGFKSATQLRAIIKKHTGYLPRAFKELS